MRNQTYEAVPMPIGGTMLPIDCGIFPQNQGGLRIPEITQFKEEKR